MRTKQIQNYLQTYQVRQQCNIYELIKRVRGQSGTLRECNWPVGCLLLIHAKGQTCLSVNYLDLLFVGLLGDCVCTQQPQQGSSLKGSLAILLK